MVLYHILPLSPLPMALRLGASLRAIRGWQKIRLCPLVSTLGSLCAYFVKAEHSLAAYLW